MPTSTPSLVLNNIEGYSEAGQANPLRWATFKRDGDTFVQQTGKIKCKDYFNDFVAKYRGHTVKIYGMDTSKYKEDTYGVFIGLWYTTPQFLGNLERALNPKLENELGFKLFPVQVGDVVLMLLPRALFENTYTISFVTLLIRACNDALEWSSYEHMVAESMESLIENQRVWLKQAPLLPPEHLRKYWYYCGPQYNSEIVQENNYSFSSLVHNNGFISWANAPGFIQKESV